MAAATVRDPVHVRAAVGDDLDEMVEVMLAEPGVEQRAFMPSLAGARVFFRELWRRAGLEHFVVAVDGDGDGEAVVGFAWCTESGTSLRDGARAATAAWGVTGPVRLLARGWARQLVELAMPEGPKLIELQTHPSRRGAGVGTMLLLYEIERFGDRPISLTTRTDNPARRLYDRHGFSVTAQRTHRAYERRTGAEGRILMVRPPDGGPPRTDQNTITSTS